MSPVRPHLYLACLCAGLAGANVAGTPVAAAAAATTAAALLAVALLLEGRRAAVALAAALLLGGWSWASARLDDLDRSVLAGRIGESAIAEVVVTGPPRHGAFALRIPADARRFASRRVGEPVLLELPLGRAPPQGARLRLAVRVVAPRTAESGFDEQGWLARRGAHVVLRGSSWRIVGRRGGIPGAGDRLRAGLAAGIAQGLDGERAAVIAGIVLGEDEQLGDELQDAFRASGLYHLLAVSGSNVGFIVLGVVGLVRVAGLPRHVGECTALAAIAAYVLAVGWQPSVVRAGVAGALASLAWLTARPSDRWWFLLAGAAVLLAWNPASLREPGFQLSFAAVAAIFLAVPRLRRGLAGYPVPARLAEVLAVSLACGVATAPIAFAQFGSVPLYTVPANAVAWPVAAPLLGLGLAAGLAAPIAPGVAAELAWANGWLAAYLAACARTFASLPGATLTSARLLLLAGLAAVAVVAGSRLPPRLRRRVAVGVAALAVLAIGWWLRPEPVPPPPDGLRVTALDIGQGDAILVQAPEGAVLVDQGPPEARVADQLERLGVHRLALLVLTHPQRDHVGGAAEVLRRLHVGLVLDPGISSESADQRAALAVARERGVRVAVARAGAVYALGQLRLRVLWPEGPGRPGEDPNDHAIVLLVSRAGADALLTADAEGDVTRRLPLPPVEILKVAHHGSADPFLPELLRRTRPRVALISVGEGNDYGHPTPSTLAALAAVPGLRTYRTDRSGRVTVDAGATRVAVREER